MILQRWAALLLVLALLAGCGSGPSNPDQGAVSPEPGQPSGDGAVTITFAAFDYERSIYEQLAQSFTAENPNIKVQIVPMEDLVNLSGDGGGQDTPLAMARRVVSGADTAPSSFLPAEAYGTSLLYDLNPLMEADASFQRDDFYPGTLERYNIQGGQWVLPRYFYVQVLSYNKDLFQQAGLTAPKAGWTWTDLMGAAEQLARKSGSQVETYGFFDYSSGFLPLMAELEARKIDLFNKPVKEVQLDDPEVIASIERIQGLIESGALYQQEEFTDKPGTNPPADPSQLIRDGRIGIWMQDIMPTETDQNGNPVNQDLGFQVGTAPYPSLGLMGMFGGGGGDGFVISGGTAYPNESWKWIEYLSRKQTDVSGGAGPGRVPSRKSLAEETGYWKGMDEEKAAAFQWALENNGVTPISSARQMEVGTILSALQEGYAAINRDKNADPGKLLAEAQEQALDRLAEAQLTPTPQPDLGPVAVATPEVEEVPEGATKIRFGAFGYNPSDLRRLARSFRDQNPEIYVEIKNTESFTGPVTLKDISRTNDCFAWWSMPQGSEDFDALLDLRPLMESDSSFQRDDIPTALYTAFESNNGTYGLPYAFNLRSLGFNRTAFDTAGVELPAGDWTPQDFLTAAQALTKGEGDKKQFGYVPLSGVATDLMFFIGQFGARMTSGSGDDLRPNFDDPKVAEAIQWYLDLAKVHKVTPPLVLSYSRDDTGSDNSYEVVRQGRAGMWFDYGVGGFGAGMPIDKISIGRPGPGLEGEQTFEAGVAPLPVGAAGLRSNDLTVRGLYISSQTQYSQECWNWVKYLSSDLSNLQSDIPARTSVALSEEYAQAAQPGLIDLYKAYEPTLKRSGEVGDNMNEVYQRLDLYWFFKAIDETNSKDADLRIGLAEAQKTTTAYVECMIQEKQKKPATCAQRVDPSYKGYNTEDPPEDGTVMPMPRG
ncbi:MAG TPA: extracellular solute-binding protein [Roseiflexaceae bacterium]|nr:extracellular solute-binding protein [Roseiflexaceae bacterium]